VPRHLWDELKVDADVSDRHVDVVEVRSLWDGVGEHTRFPIARLRDNESTGLCAIYARDRHLKFHEYKRVSARPRTSQPSCTTSAAAATRSLGLANGSLTVDMVENSLYYMRPEAPLLAPILRSDGLGRSRRGRLRTGSGILMLF
jgi:hypothetical protein